MSTQIDLSRNSYNSTMMLEKIKSLTQSCIQELYKTITNISNTCKQISSINEIRIYDSLVRILIRLTKVIENLPGSGVPFNKTPSNPNLNEEENKLIIFHNFVETFCHDLHGKLQFISENLESYSQEILLKYVRVIKTLHEQLQDAFKKSSRLGVHQMTNFSMPRESLRGGSKNSSSLRITTKTSLDSVIPLNAIVMDKVIGQGSYGKVYRGNYFGEIVAVKQIKLLSEEHKEFLKREIYILSQLSHLNIMKFVGVAREKEMLYLVTELIYFGELSRFLHAKAVSPKNWLLMTKVAYESASALAYMHEQNILHCDIKTENLLVHENWTIKLCDFGFARTYTPGQKMRDQNMCGSAYFAAPEVIRTQPFDDKGDVFAFGVFLMEWLTLGVIPFVRNKSTNYEFNFEDIRKFYPPDTPESIDRLSISCCNYFSHKRPPMKKIHQILELLYESVRLEGKHRIPPVPSTFSFDYDSKTKALLNQQKSKGEDDLSSSPQDYDDEFSSNPLQYLVNQSKNPRSSINSNNNSNGNSNNGNDNNGININRNSNNSSNKVNTSPNTVKKTTSPSNNSQNTTNSRVSGTNNPNNKNRTTSNPSPILKNPTTGFSSPNKNSNLNNGLNNLNNIGNNNKNVGNNNNSPTTPVRSKTTNYTDSSSPSSRDSPKNPVKRPVSSPNPKLDIHSNNTSSENNLTIENNNNNISGNNNNIKVTPLKLTPNKTKKPLPKRKSADLENPNPTNPSIRKAPKSPHKAPKSPNKNSKNITLKDGDFEKLKQQQQHQQQHNKKQNNSNNKYNNNKTLQRHSGSALLNHSEGAHLLNQDSSNSELEEKKERILQEEKSTLSYKNPKNSPSTSESFNENFKFSEKSYAQVQIKINNRNVASGEEVVFEVTVDNNAEKRKIESIQYLLRNPFFIKKDTGTFDSYLSPFLSNTSSCENIFPIAPYSTKKFYLFYRFPTALQPNNFEFSQFYELHFNFIFKSTFKKVTKTTILKFNVVPPQKVFETNPNHVFGSPLSLILLRENQSLPNLIIDSIQYFNNNISHFRDALEAAETIFGRGGKIEEANFIRYLYDSGNRLIGGNLKFISDPNSVIKALQIFLMMLPQPLFTSLLYPSFVQIYDSLHQNTSPNLSLSSGSNSPSQQLPSSPLNKRLSKNLKESLEKNISPYWSLFDKLSLQRKQIIAHLLTFFIKVTVSLEVTIEQISFTWAYPIFLRPDVIPKDTKELALTISKAHSIMREMLQDLSDKRYMFQTSLLSYSDTVDDPFF